MDIEIYRLILVGFVSLLACYVQTVSGFGFGIVAMIFLPSLLLYTEANMVSSILSTVTSLIVLIAMYKKVNWRNIIFPIIGSFIANYVAITFMKTAANDLLTLLLGNALFCLSIYFFFFSEKIKIKPTWYTGLIAGVISGIMGGLFSIGGPPVVIYYMQSEKDTDSYLSTISAYFVLSGIISVSMKAASGFFTKDVLFGIIIGLIFMLAGSYLGSKTRGKADSKLIRKIVYAVMAVSGIANVITSLI